MADADLSCPAAQRFLQAALACASEGTLVQLVLSKPRQADGLQQVAVKPWLLQGQTHWSIKRRWAAREETDNALPQAAWAALAPLVGTAFAHAHLYTTHEVLQLRFGKRGTPALTQHAAALPPGAVGGPGQAPRQEGLQGHQRTKLRLLSLDAPFVQALGVADEQGRLVPSMARKWKQINKFAELLDHALHRSGLLPREAASAPLRIADFGCGRGYLTFALHHLLAGHHSLPCEVVGVELRQGLVDECNGVVDRLGLQGLRFVCGDVAHTPVEAVDVMVALHACDTATDVAMYAGVAAGAALIVCAPCCHKELRPQLRKPAALAPLLRHGIHLAQEAEMLTDTLRALRLAACGYDAQVLEFITLEHTAKNKMVLAARTAAAQRPAAREQAEREAQALQAFYGVERQRLADLLRRAASTDSAS